MLLLLMLLLGVISVNADTNPLIEIQVPRRIICIENSTLGNIDVFRDLNNKLFKFTPTPPETKLSTDKECQNKHSRKKSYKVIHFLWRKMKSDAKEPRPNAFSTVKNRVLEKFLNWSTITGYSNYSNKMSRKLVQRSAEMSTLSQNLTKLKDLDKNIAFIISEPVYKRIIRGKPLMKIREPHLLSLMNTQTFEPTLQHNNNVTYKIDKDPSEMNLALDLKPEETTATLSSMKNITKINDITHQDFESTTFNDKIRFFEIYDQGTEAPENSPNIWPKENETYKRLDDWIEFRRIEKTNISSDIVTKKKRHYSTYDDKEITAKNLTNKLPYIQYNLQEKENYVNKSAQNDEIVPTTECSALHSNREASWSDFPFMAVYVYEPSQVHCDAAAISPHWLVAAGSCLSRHSQEPSLGGRSAFVSYCGVHWRKPERIAYVKYSIVHPKFHPRNQRRSYIYNIGLIRVVNSLSACAGWRPVQIMSHQFLAQKNGTLGHAVGWALDRYGAKYNSMQLPKWPLMIYDSVVYSNTCPGNIGYTKLKSRAVARVYCLSLPPYVGENTDPIHGSFLLIGGKLIAVYLHEERRAIGEQSAVYTAVWKLIPWLTNVAHEPESSEF